MKKKLTRPTLADKRIAAKNKDQPRYGAKRERILNAARVVLHEVGLGGTTIEAIAHEAGVDRATIYYYFEDKHAIFRETIRTGLVELVEDLKAIAASGETPPVRLRRSISAVMHAYEKHYPQLYLYLKDGGTSAIIDNDLNREIIESGRAYEALLEATVRDGVAAGVIEIGLPPKALAKLVVGMLNWTSWWFVPGGALTAHDIAEGVADLVLDGTLVRSSADRAFADISNK
jgi:AcrR family transcriptional regulator